MSTASKGLRWRKASDERSTGDVTAPGLILYPGSQTAYRDAECRYLAGTRDALALVNEVVNGSSTPSIWDQLPVMLADPAGHYDNWNFTDELVTVSDVIDLMNDAYLALALERNLAADGLAMPYAALYSAAGKPGFAESVCTFEFLLQGYSYDSAVSDCGNFLEESTPSPGTASALLTSD